MFAITGAPLSARTATSHDPFLASPVWQVDIRLTPQRLNSLRDHSRDYVRATVRVLGQAFDDVALKLKGHGSFQPVDEKPSFTLDFSRFNPDQDFRGLSKIHLNNSLHDPSYLKEQIATELFLAAGVPAPRIAHALVSLNGRPLGLYLVKEGFTRAFVGRHFQDNSGNLYDDDDGHDVDQTMDRDLAADSTDDQIELKRLAAAACEPEPTRRWELLNDTLEVDAFLRFMAMELMIGHWDGYCLGQNNFRVYHNPQSNRIVFLPSGMDQVFAKADLDWKPEMTGLVARAVLETPEGEEQYGLTFRKLFTDVYDPAALVRRIDELLDDLRPSIESMLFTKLRQEADELRRQIVQRAHSLQSQLNRPEPAFPVFDQDVALVTGWLAFDPPAEGKMLEGLDPESREVLRIIAGPKTFASWRTTLRLKKGRYRFEGRARTTGVTPLPFGSHQGGSLRAAESGEQSAGLVGTTDWTQLSTRFEVRAPEETIVLICQLRASAGQVWFEKCSLHLCRER